MKKIEFAFVLIRVIRGQNLKDCLCAFALPQWTQTAP